MKRFLSLMICLALLLTLCACGKKSTVVTVSPTPAPTEAPAQTPEPTPEPEPTETPKPTPTPEPIPLVPELPPVHDAALNDVLYDVLTVWPGAAGCSLRAAERAARLLDWGMNTTLSDDEIYSAVGCFLDELSDEDLLLFQESFYSVYDTAYDLRGENARGLLEDAGAEDCLWPWNDHAFHALEMVSYGLGPR